MSKYYPIFISFTDSSWSVYFQSLMCEWVHFTDGLTGGCKPTVSGLQIGSFVFSKPIFMNLAVYDSSDYENFIKAYFRQ